VLPLCVFISGAGLYGAVAVSKYYERSSYHLSQARALTKDLAERGVLGTDERLVKARADHYRAFPRMYRIRLHRLWVVLHFAIGLYGLSLLLVCGHGVIGAISVARLSVLGVGWPWAASPLGF
ncbi:hypothetical protein, partial [Streptosporangium sp. V21-05]|uniref:hypothetical protein n=1 Tax=Streptosporangium sp. V21-05 TaxID=3446115 RepID=UPI003F530B4D